MFDKKKPKSDAHTSIDQPFETTYVRPEQVADRDAQQQRDAAAHERDASRHRDTLPDRPIADGHLSDQRLADQTTAERNKTLAARDQRGPDGQLLDDDADELPAPPPMFDPKKITRDGVSEVGVEKIPADETPPPPKEPTRAERRLEKKRAEAPRDGVSEVVPAAPVAPTQEQVEKQKEIVEQGPQERPNGNPDEAALREAFLANKSVEVYLVGVTERAKVAGLNVDREKRVYPLSRVFGLGAEYVRMLAQDPTVNVRII